jgi:vacuolar protein sorting-associated protein 13A/C
VALIYCYQLRGQPVRVHIDNVYLLAVPASDSTYDPEEDDRRSQQLKQEKLESAELLTAQPSAGMSAEDQQKNESFTASLINRIIDNVQITVSKVHIRYEDKLSVPGHPFSAGITLDGFSAVSTDEHWEPVYISNPEHGIHKLAKLECLAVYFDTDSESLAGYPKEEATTKFNELIATDSNTPKHQFILKPVTGAGRLIMNRHPTSEVPKTDAELLFKELAFVLDEDQHRDVLSMVDLFHFYTRQHQYRRFRPSEEELTANRPKALFQFAQQAILNEVHEKRRQWTWDYFKERRDDRIAYIDLFKRSATNTITPEVR